MKRLAFGLCLAVSFASTMGVVKARGDQDFTLVNRTGLTINELYVSPARASHWGEDVLGRDTLDDGDSVEVRFSRKEDECVWDLKVVDEDGDAVNWEAINLCQAEKITLKYDRKQPTALIQ